MTNIFILAAQRSAIGSYGGSLKDTPPIDLAIPVAKDAIAKSGCPLMLFSMRFMVMSSIPSRAICIRRAVFRLALALPKRPLPFRSIAYAEVAFRQL